MNDDRKNRAHGVFRTTISRSELVLSVVGQNVQGSRYRCTKTSPDLSDGIRTKAAGYPRLAEDWSSNSQLLKCNWDVYSRLPFSQWATSGKTTNEIGHCG